MGIMTFYPNERIAIFIDGANFYGAARGLQVDVDYRKLLDEFKARGRLVRAAYYTAILEDSDYSPVRPLADWLDYNGFAVVTKPAKEFTDINGRRRIKGDMDIEIAVDMLEMADKIDHMILFSGDGDFRKLVEAVQRRGVRVTVVSTLKTSPPMIADELRRQADTFIELLDLITLIGRPPRPDGAYRDDYDDGYDDEEDYDDGPAAEDADDGADEDEDSGQPV
jgi:uncharacterized LabA/DUF88 family protein